MNILAVHLPGLSRHLVETGLSLLLQSALLLTAGLLAIRLARHYGPAAQYLLYRATLLSVFICGLTFIALPHRIPTLWRLSLPPAQGIQDDVATSGVQLSVAPKPSPASSQSEFSGASTESASNTPNRQAAVQVIPSKPISTISATWPADPFRAYFVSESESEVRWIGRVYIALVILWLFVALGRLLWLLIGYAEMGRILRRSRTVVSEDIITLLRELCAVEGVRPPRIMESDEAQSISLAGLWRPTLLFPAVYRDSFDHEVLRAVLAHEVAHLVWRDPLWTLFVRVLCALGWPQPLLWLACRHGEQAGEEACDLAAVTKGSPPRVYASCLLSLAERMALTRAERVAGTGILTGRSSLGRRMQRLLQTASSAPWRISQHVRFRVTLGAACATVPLVLLLPDAGAREQDDWTKDVRLNQRVRITAEGIPLNELLPMASEKTSVGLSAAKYLADEKVIVLGPARPLKETLADIAALYNAQWSVGTAGGKPRYTLTQSLRTRQYEQRLANANEERMLAQLEALVWTVREPAGRISDRPQNDPIRQALSNEDGRNAASIFALLTPAQRAQLVQTWRAQVPVSSLSADQKRHIEPMFFGERFKPFANGLAPDQIPREEMDRHAMKFEIMGGGGDLRKSGFMAVMMSAPTGFNQTVMHIHNEAKFVLPPHGNPYTGEAIKKDARLPESKAVRGSAGEAWADRLVSLAARTGRPVVSDYYRSKPIFVATEDSSADSADTPMGAMDAFCRPAGYMWWTRGNTTLFRKRDWYNQRQYEVPDRWVLALVASLKEHNGIPTYGDVFSLLDLSMNQIVGLMESAGGIADRRLLAGLPELLAAAAAARIERSASVVTGVITPDSSLNVAVKPNLGDPRQRTLVDAFLGSFNRKILEPGTDWNGRFGFVFHNGAGGAQNPGDQMLRLGVHIITDGTLHAGYLVSLPLVLPDDRRDRTRIEIVQ